MIRKSTVISYIPVSAHNPDKILAQYLIGTFLKNYREPTTSFLKFKLHALKHLAGIALGQELGGWQMHVGRLVDLVGLI